MDSVSKGSESVDDLSSTTAPTKKWKHKEVKYRIYPSKVHFKCGKRLSKFEDISCTNINPKKLLFSVNSKEELKSLNTETSKVKNTVVSFSKRDANIVIVTSQDTLDESQFNEWREQIAVCISQYLEGRVHEDNLQITHENFDLAKRKLHITSESDIRYLYKVLVVFEDDSKVAHIVGHLDDVNAFGEDIVAKVKKSETVTWKSTINPVESELAFYGLLGEKLSEQCPLVNIVEMDRESDEIEITGFECDVHEAKEFVSTFFNTTSQLTTTLSDRKMDFIIKKEEIKGYIERMLKSEERTKDWTWLIVDHNIILTGPKETKLDEKLISDLLYEKEFELSEFESETVFTSRKWEKKQLELTANYNSHMILEIDQDCLILLCTSYFKNEIVQKIKSMLIKTKTLQVSPEFGEFLQLRGKSILESRCYDLESDFLEFSLKKETSEIEVKGTAEGVKKLKETFSVMQDGYKKQKFAITCNHTFSRLNSPDGRALIEKVGLQKRSLLKIKAAPVISIVREKIEEQRTSIIVNSVSMDLKLNVGQPKIATAIYEKGGEGFQRHISEKWPSGIQFGDMVTSEKKGNLACDWVFNCCLQEHKDDETTRKNLKEMLLKCLEETKDKDRNYKSIAIPALGTGVLRYPANIAARTTFDVICKFCAQNETSSLEEIKIVLFPDAPQPVRKYFQDEFARRSVERGGLLQLASDNIAPGYLWIYSESQNSLDETLEMLQKSLS